MVSRTRSGHLQSFLPKRFTAPEQGASLNAERLPRSPIRSGRHQSGCHASSVIHESTSFVPTCWGKGRRAAREDALAQPVPHPWNVLRPPPSRFQWTPWVPLGAGPAPAQIPQRGGDGGDTDGEGNAVQSQVDSICPQSPANDGHYFPSARQPRSCLESEASLVQQESWRMTQARVQEPETPGVLRARKKERAALGTSGRSY